MSRACLGKNDAVPPSNLGEARKREEQEMCWQCWCSFPVRTTATVATEAVIIIFFFLFYLLLPRVVGVAAAAASAATSAGVLFVVRVGASAAAAAVLIRLQNGGVFASVDSFIGAGPSQPVG